MHIPTLPHTSYCNMHPARYTHPQNTHLHTLTHTPTQTYRNLHMPTYTHTYTLKMSFHRVCHCSTDSHTILLWQSGFFVVLFFPPLSVPSPSLSPPPFTMCVCVCGCSNGVCSSGKAHLQIINSSTSAISSWSPLCFCARLLPPIW